MQTEVLHKIAHDPGDPLVTSHCPFCGSGQVVGRSDGTIACDFCGMNYIVRVQPAFPGMPQGPLGPGAPTDTGPELLGQGEIGPDGEPLPPDAGEDGAPPFGDEEGGIPPGEEEEEEAEGPPFGGDDGDGDDDDDGPPAKDDSKGKKKPPPSKKKGARYRTHAGAVLPEDAYVRHLAVLHSGGSPRVLAQLRAEAVQRAL